ncbi:GDSL lipase/esterase [Dillenia turbinata]|uniref:GDSL lipase/esterase n=1 Tax=Dillenia turbinata TaxID=194707 RepID=A0AAN8VPQ5_9MAGN
MGKAACLDERMSMVLVVVTLTTILQWSCRVQGMQVPAMFVFGDSLVDDGNNNYLNSIAKANYLPYGIDFNGGPSGRFTNGKTFVDILADLLGVPYPQAFSDPTTSGARILSGVNYASAAGGILDETGQHYGERYGLSQQVLNFETTLDQLRTLMSGRNLTQYLANSMVVMVFGSNDYINNYLMPSIYSSSYNYSPPDFANLLLNHFARQILVILFLSSTSTYLDFPILILPSSQLSKGYD